MNLKIICFTGGTLGHIMPCVTLIKEMKKRYIESYIVVVATSKDIGYEALKIEEIDKIYFIESSKASFNIKDQLNNLKAYSKIKQIIKEEDVKIAYGFGGYISGIGIFAARNLKLKTYLHEQNSVMGKANKILSKYVDKVFLSYPVKKMRKNYIIVGSPVYIQAQQVKKNIYKLRNKILFTSGTLGSKEINQLAVNLILGKHLTNYDVTIITGKKYYNDVCKILKNTSTKIYEFSNCLIEQIASVVPMTGII